MKLSRKYSLETFLWGRDGGFGIPKDLLEVMALRHLFPTLDKTRFGGHGERFLDVLSQNETLPNRTVLFVCLGLSGVILDIVFSMFLNSLLEGCVVYNHSLTCVECGFCEPMMVFGDNFLAHENFSLAHGYIICSAVLYLVLRGTLPVLHMVTYVVQYYVERFHDTTSCAERTRTPSHRCWKK
jgi:hypothetical protein